MHRFTSLAAVFLLIAGTAIGDPIRIVCLGDSVTKAVRPGVESHETFCALLEKQLTTADRPVRVINAGIGGHTTADGLKRFQTDVLDHKPHFVVLMFGLNDSWIDSGQSASRLTVEQYRANLREMIATLTAKGAQVILMTPNPALSPTYGPERNATLKPYVTVVRQLAAEHHLPLIDIYRHFAELTLEAAEINSLFTDDMHPNPAGQAQIAKLLHEHFTAALADSGDAPASTQD
jgi:lysophospholipase L1-like esterase